MIEDRLARIQADSVINAGEQFTWMNGILCWCRSRIVRFAVHVASTNSGTGDQPV